MKKPYWAVLIVVLAIALGAGGIYRVDEGEEALVLTFSEITDRKGPGLYWHIPFIQEIMAESVTEIKQQEFGFRTNVVSTTTSAAQYSDVDEESIMITGDSNIVDVNVVYQYVIKDVSAYFFQVNDTMSTLHLAFETMLRRNIQNRTLDDALLNKQDIEMQVMSDLRDIIMEYNMGIELREVRIQNIVVPSEVTSAYEDVNNAKNEMTSKLDEAEKYYYEVVYNARAKAYKLEQEAEAYKTEKIAVAEGDVANFLQIYEKYQSAKEVTRNRLMIETMEKILSSSTKIVADGDIVKFLPLGSGTGSEGSENRPAPSSNNSAVGTVEEGDGVDGSDN